MSETRAIVVTRSGEGMLDADVKGDAYDRELAESLQGIGVDAAERAPG